MAEYLRSDEILACVHRIALSRGAPFTYSPEPPSPEMERRRRGAGEHRREVLELLAARHPDALRPRGEVETTTMLRDGAPLILLPRLPREERGRRYASVHALVRVGRVDERFTFAPLLIKNH